MPQFARRQRELMRELPLYKRPAWRERKTALTHREKFRTALTHWRYKKHVLSWKIIHFLFLKLQNESCAYTGWNDTVSSQPIGRRSFVNLGQKWRSEKWKARIIPSLEFLSYWNLAKCETLEAALLLLFPLSCLHTCSVLWPFWWQGHWQQAHTIVGFPLWVITYQVKRKYGIKYYIAFFAVIVNGRILAKCLAIIIVFPRLLCTKLTAFSTIIGYLP